MYTFVEKVVFFLLLVTTKCLISKARHTSLVSDDVPKQNTDQGRFQRSFGVSEEFKRVAVEEHNKARFNVSPPASNMQKMVWNDDLATTAQNYGDKCDWEHNPRRTEDTRNKIWTPKDVGENLYYTTAAMSDEEVMKIAVVKWDAEKIDYDFNTGDCTENKVCGHYTQVVWYNTVYVGCGISHCPGNKKMITCNYGPAGNWIGEAPYSTGRTSSKSKAKPKTGPPSKPSGSSSSGKPSSSTSNKLIYAGMYCVSVGFKFQEQKRGKLELGAGRRVIYRVEDKNAGKWTKVNIQIMAKGGGPKLYMKGTLLKNTNSFIAMDDISVKEGGCPRKVK